MMKKLLVLSLVLAVAGLANAALVFENGKVIYSLDEEVVGGINSYIGTSAGPAAFGAFEFRTGEGAPVSAPEFTDYTGQDAIDNSLPWTLGFVNLVWGDASITPNPAGIWYSIEVVGDYVVGTAEQFDLQIDVMNAFDGSMASLFLASAVIPEPMTMGLLGLGALFLRRRK